MVQRAQMSVALLIKIGEKFLLSSKKIRMITKKTKNIAIPATTSRMPLILSRFILCVLVIRTRAFAYCITLHLNGFDVKSRDAPLKIIGFLLASHVACHLERVGRGETQEIPWLLTAY